MADAIIEVVTNVEENGRLECFLIHFEILRVTRSGYWPGS